MVSGLNMSERNGKDLPPKFVVNLEKSLYIYHNENDK